MKPAAMKNGKLYSQQPHSGAGDFNFSRADGVQTRINKNGLIETVADNEPRLSYDIVDGKVSDCPHLLLEPQRTNYAVKSEEFDDSNWQKVRATIAANQIVSPDGSVTADLLTATDTTENYCQQNVNSTVSGSKQTASFFVKKGTSDFCHILLWDVSNDGARQWFDLTNGSVGTSTTFGSGVTVDSAQMINYGDDWYRCIVVFNNSNTAVRIRISVSNSNGSTSSTSGKTIYIWGAQLTVGGYETSYIPTSGTTETRRADTCNGSGNSETFNSSEGVLYAELEALVDNDVSNRYISIANSAGTNFVTIQYRTSGSNFRVYQNGVGSSNIVYVANIDLTDSLKVAVKYGTSPSDYAVYINGINRTLNLGFVAGTMSGLSELKFLYGSGGAPWYGKAKELTVINEALTDEQLQLLTTP